MRKLQYLSILIVILAFGTGFLAYNQLPDKVASHWNLQGKVDGYTSRAMGSFLLPVLGLIFLALFYVIPKIDPRKQAYASFMHEYDELVAVLLAFFYYLFVLVIAYNMGYSFNLLQFLAPAFAVMFFYMGKTLIKSKQNYFVGFRTPWTLASRRVWDKTNVISGKLFLAAALVALSGVIVPGIGLIISIAMLVAIAAFGIVYSYVEYSKEKKTGRHGSGRKKAKGRKARRK